MAYLRGTVDSYIEKAQAENIADRANGVIRVRNYLQVNYPGMLAYSPYIYPWTIYDYPWYDAGNGAHKTDSQIVRDIESELTWSPFVDADDIHVHVEEGIATLTGNVDSWNEYRAASQNAFEGGAAGVINHLEIN